MTYCRRLSSVEPVVRPSVNSWISERCYRIFSEIYQIAYVLWPNISGRLFQFFYNAVLAIWRPFLGQNWPFLPFFMTRSLSTVSTIFIELSELSAYTHAEL